MADHSPNRSNQFRAVSGFIALFAVFLGIWDILNDLKNWFLGVLLDLTAFVLTVLTSALFGLIGTLFTKGTEAFLFFRPPNSVPQLEEMWADFFFVYVAVLPLIGASFWLMSMLFPHNEDADPLRFVERAFLSAVALIATAPIWATFEAQNVSGMDLFSACVYAVNTVGQYIFPSTYNLNFFEHGIGTLGGAVGATLGTTGGILALILLGWFFGLAILLTVLTFYAVLAMRMLLVYTVYAAMPLLLAMWIIDVGPGKYANMVASIIFKVTAVLLLFGIVISAILGTTSAIAGGGVEEADRIKQWTSNGTVPANATVENLENPYDPQNASIDGDEPDYKPTSLEGNQVAVENLEEGLSIVGPIYSGTIETIHENSYGGPVNVGGKTYVILFEGGHRTVLGADTVVTVVEDGGNEGSSSNSSSSSTGSANSVGVNSNTGMNSNGADNASGVLNDQPQIGTGTDGAGFVLVMIQMFSWVGGIVLSIALTTSALGMVISMRGASGTASRLRQGRSGDAPTGPQTYGGGQTGQTHSGDDSILGPDDVRAGTQPTFPEDEATIPADQRRGDDLRGVSEDAPEPTQTAPEGDNDWVPPRPQDQDQSQMIEAGSGADSMDENRSGAGREATQSEDSTGPSDSSRSKQQTQPNQVKDDLNGARIPEDANISQSDDGTTHVNTDEQNAAVDEDGVSGYETEEGPRDTVPLTEKMRYSGRKASEWVDEQVGGEGKADIAAHKDEAMERWGEAKETAEEWTEEVGPEMGEEFEGNLAKQGENFEQRMSNMAEDVDDDLAAVQYETIGKTGRWGGKAIGKTGNLMVSGASKMGKGLMKSGNLAKRGTKSYVSMLKQPTLGETMEEAHRIGQESSIGKPNPPTETKTAGPTDPRPSETRDGSPTQNVEPSPSVDDTLEDERPDHWSDADGKTETNGTLGSHQLYNPFGAEVNLRGDAPMESIDDDIADEIINYGDYVDITSRTTSVSDGNDRMGQYELSDETSSSKFTDDNGHVRIADSSEMKQIEGAQLSYDNNGDPNQITLTDHTEVSDAGSDASAAFGYGVVGGSTNSPSGQTTSMNERQTESGQGTDEGGDSSANTSVGDLQDLFQEVTGTEDTVDQQKTE